ncbi:protein hsr-9 [Ditylenchus destructor]|uniref:Protein hsr-9 n=1 Tax=Ditylenchus destructor TaxID=166010 RepID=A0AAD4NL34_9BILA|nr:protein hsr-9 [Ditylenchus destructor]
MAPTPTRKRKSSAPTGETSVTVSDVGGSGGGPSSAKKTRRSRKSDATRVISLDGDDQILRDDPFSFDKKADSHPEPLKNISVERTAFGGMKFSRSPPTSSDRYASLERRATVSGTPSSSLTLPAGTPGGLGANLKEQMMTSFNKSRSSTPRSTKKNTANQPADETFKLEEEESEKITSAKKASTQATESASGKRKSRASEFNEKAASIYEDKKKKDDPYKVPDLNAAEQLEVDHAFEEHQLLSAGARVLALWEREYYPAYVCGREGLGRYFVHFVEDNLSRLLPPTGVIPLAALSAGQKVTYLTIKDNEELGKVAEIVNMPSREDADAWVEGLLELQDDEVEESDEIIKVPWQKIILSKEQYAKINKPVNKPVNLVDRENIVNESRSSRRSRASRISTEDLTTSTVTTPQPSTRTSRASRTPRVQKTAILSEG